MARQNSSRYDFQDDKIVWYLDTYTNLPCLASQEPSQILNQILNYQCFKTCTAALLQMRRSSLVHCVSICWHIGRWSSVCSSPQSHNSGCTACVMYICRYSKDLVFIVEKLLSVIQDSWTFTLQVCRTSTTTTSPMSSLVLIRWPTGTWTWTKHRRTTTGSPATFAWSTMAVQTPLKVVQLATCPTMIVTILSTGTGSKIMTRVSSY